MSHKRPTLLGGSEGCQQGRIYGNPKISIQAGDSSLYPLESANLRCSLSRRGESECSTSNYPCHGLPGRAAGAGALGTSSFGEGSSLGFRVLT